MSQKPYLNTFHFMTKVMADVEYPIFKKDLIAQVGNSEIPMDWDETVVFSQLIEAIKIDKFESAASFYNALVAVL
ncbi:MAG TPA: hypothetical protein VFD17_00440 [Clostridia bacterium]|nr:hypothetical protein [Clostridia bacterium]